MTKLYDRLGYNYAKNIFDIHAEFTTDTENSEVVVTLSTLGDGDIYYTLDGSEPTSASNKYEAPVKIKENATIKPLSFVRQATAAYSLKNQFQQIDGKTRYFACRPSKGYDFKGVPK